MLLARINPWERPKQCCFSGSWGWSLSPGARPAAAPSIALRGHWWCGEGAQHGWGGMPVPPCIARQQLCLFSVFWKWVCMGRVRFRVCVHLGGGAPASPL